ncbi:helix-hairpin-helix domain-containing protein [bacterium]|nr:helix-hairpin-helix domain-containing protein [bacterium]
MWRTRRDYYLTPMQYIILICAAFLGQGNVTAILIWAIVLSAIYYGVRHSINIENIDFGALMRRREAIQAAKIYLAPHRSIWKNLTLSNKHCRLELGEQASIIVGIEKVPPYRKFNVINSFVHSYEDLWDMFCKSFSFSKTYEALKEDCNRYRVSINEFVDESQHQKTQSPVIATSINTDKSDLKKIDINNSSEIELTELPGISIINAKKIVMKREEIGGFKTEEQLFEYLNLKPHLQEQLKTRIVINKKQGSLQIKKSSERNLDL